MYRGCCTYMGGEFVEFVRYMRGRECLTGSHGSCEVSFWWCGRGNDAMQEWVSGGQSRLLHGREREET